MGPFLLIAAIAFFLYCAFAQHVTESHKENEKQEPKSLKCPPHQWNYEQDHYNEEIMICKACRQRPSHSPRE
jgi:hypothetical protein